MSDDEYSDDVSLGSDDESVEQDQDQELAKPFTKNTLKSNLPSFVKKASNLTLEGDDDEVDGEDSEDEDIGDEDVGEDLEGGDIEDVEDEDSGDEDAAVSDEENEDADLENKTSKTKKSNKKTNPSNSSNTLLEESIKKNNILIDVDTDDEDEDSESGNESERSNNLSLKPVDSDGFSSESDGPILMRKFKPVKSTPQLSAKKLALKELNKNMREMIVEKHSEIKNSLHQSRFSKVS